MTSLPGQPRCAYSERMRRSPLRTSFAAAAATALLLGLTACGSDDAENASDEPVISESEEGDSEPAADQPADGELVDNGEFVDDMMAGLEKSTTAHMTMNMDFGGGAMDAEGVVDYTTEPVSMAMTMVLLERWVFVHGQRPPGREVIAREVSQMIIYGISARPG